MKRFVLALAAVMMLSLTVNAQDNHRRQGRQMSKEEMIQRRTDRLAEDLGLNDSQKAALLKLNTEYADKLGNGMRPRTGVRKERTDSVKKERPSAEQMQKLREEMQATRDSYNAELKKIVTEEQYAKYEKLQKERMQRFGNRQRGGRGGNHND